eukprot:scaffold4961_cov114-Isochrysis_galbana.AAC.3
MPPSACTTSVGDARWASTTAASPRWGLVSSGLEAGWNTGDRNAHCSPMAAARSTSAAVWADAPSGQLVRRRSASQSAEPERCRPSPSEAATETAGQGLDFRSGEGRLAEEQSTNARAGERASRAVKGFRVLRSDTRRDDQQPAAMCGRELRCDGRCRHRPPPPTPSPIWGTL